MRLVYAHPLRQAYVAPLLGKARAFNVLLNLIALILPYLIVYGSQSMWIKTNTYREQPHVEFTHQYLIIVQGDAPNDYQLWSTFPTLNRLAGAGHLRLATCTAIAVCVCDQRTRTRTDGHNIRSHQRPHRNNCAHTHE
jgi:hypothetical protein